MTDEMPENTGEIQDGKFKPGQSGNPAGRPRGALNKTTVAVQALLMGEAEALTRVAIEKALEGDTTALRLCLERILPVRKDVPVSVDLPPICDLGSAMQAQAAIVQAVSSGDITPAEANSMCALVEVMIRGYEAQEIERRLCELEARLTEAKK